MSHDARYEIILYWSDEDRAFIAEVPELPGCAADGSTYQEALANVQTIMTEWIETAQELGRPFLDRRAGSCSRSQCAGAGVHTALYPKKDGRGKGHNRSQEES